VGVGARWGRDDPQASQTQAGAERGEGGSQPGCGDSGGHILTHVATRLEATPQQVALAWLLQRSATTVLIPGTSSVAHLHGNVAAADLKLPADAVAELDTIGR